MGNKKGIGFKGTYRLGLPFFQRSAGERHSVELKKNATNAHAQKQSSQSSFTHKSKQGNNSMR
jgi:hypothetical protein